MNLILYSEDLTDLGRSLPVDKVGTGHFRHDFNYGMFDCVMCVDEERGLAKIVSHSVPELSGTVIDHEDIGNYL
jgi:hypothetical protein